MSEYEILSFIHKKSNNVSTNKLYAESLGSNDPDYLTDRQRVSYLIEEGLVSGNAEIGSMISVTAKGIFRLDALTQERRNQAKQRRHEWMLAIFSALAGALLSEPLWTLLGKLFS